MRISHKRKVQKKLQKRINALNVSLINSDTKSVVATSSVAAKVAKPAAKVSVALTPKQQQVLDIVAHAADGINPKSIGLEAGQEETKAAAWATGALKKLLEENLVEKVQVSGNKVLYKSL